MFLIYGTQFFLYVRFWSHVKFIRIFVACTLGIARLVVVQQPHTIGIAKNFTKRVLRHGNNEQIIQSHQSFSVQVTSELGCHFASPRVIHGLFSEHILTPMVRSGTHIDIFIEINFLVHWRQ